MVNFSENWNNKLNWGMFSTWRLFTPDKYKFYQSKLNKLDDMKLKGKTFTNAYLNWIVISKLKDIPDYMKMADTGLSPKEFDKLMETMYSNKPEWKGQDTIFMGLYYVKSQGVK